MNGAGRLHFCTLFDAGYAARGLVMLESLARHCTSPHRVSILAMDDAAARMVEAAGRPHWRILRVADLGDGEFAALEGRRPHREFCWTAAPALCHHLVASAPEGSMVAYLDADLMFFRDPAELLAELDGGGSILIHEHRFSPDRAEYEASSGRFNVGFVGFRVGEEARACTERWRAQVIALCVLDPARGLCGDQGYLNEWPTLYPGLRIMRNIGGGVAPWNLAAYRVGGTPRAPSVDGVPVVFFHYHSFRTVRVGGFGLLAVLPAHGYAFPRPTMRLLFSIYAGRIRACHTLLCRRGFALATDLAVGLGEALRGLVSGRYLPATGTARREQRREVLG
ncbi:MAG: hypothetical protein IT556_00165 [Acetobacteraceae bacterium]|nr:hypothetical protein [Acetobacteraceae bacterium]